MKKFFDELRGARNIEWFLAALAIAILLLMLWNTDHYEETIKTSQELRLADTLKRIDGVGKLDIMISDEPQLGILVVAEGADNLKVCLRLQYALQTLTGAEAGRIEIVPYQK